MNYHLNRNGQNLGIFSLEELRQRRASGELTGEELVWRAGMTNWQLLDSILQQSTPGVSPPPIPASARKKSILMPIIIGAVVILVIIAAIGMSTITFKRAIQGFNRGFQQAQRTSRYHPPDDGTNGLAAASKPVVVSTNSLTAKQVMVHSREFATREYLTGYELRGERNPASDLLAMNFLTNWVAYNYGGEMNTNLPPLYQMADQLAADPACTDPLVLCLAGVESVEVRASVARLERAVKSFKSSKHLGYPAFYAAAVLGTEAVKDKTFKDRVTRIRELDAMAMEELDKAFVDGSFRPEDQTEIAQRLLLGWGEGFFRRNSAGVINTVKLQGQAYSWLALVLEGQQQIDAAWAARGGGYANTVSSNGWQGFNDHLANARTALTEAWQMQPDRPQAASMMIYVSLGDSDIDEMRTWFDRAVDAQIDYPEAWSNLRWGLRPRWYGSPAAMLAFGRAALNTGRFDTDVPRKFFDSVNDVQSELDVHTYIYGRNDIWPDVQKMYNGYIAANEKDPQADWHSPFAVVAYLAGKQDTAREQLKILNWQPDQSTLTSWGLDLSLLAPEVAARTGAQSMKVAQAENCREVNDLAGALKLYHELDHADLDSPSRTFVNDREASLEIENRLHAGEWVNFLPTTTNLTGWVVERGQCQVLPDGALEVASDAQGHLLYSHARPGRDFEVRGQFEVVHSSDQQFEGGLVIGLPQFKSENWYAFRIKRTLTDGDCVTYSQHWSQRQILVRNPVNDGTNSFWISFHNGEISATVNGHEVFQEAGPPKNSKVDLSELMLGLGAFNNSDSTVIRYRDVQVHQIGRQ